MFKHILVPTDGSSMSEQAAAAAIDLARAQGGDIVAVSIAQPYPMMAAEAMVVLDAATESRILLGLAQDNVDKVVQLAQAAGVPCKGVIAMSYFPHDEIIKAAADNHCDVVFMASHGRHGIGKLLAGSVTQNVLAYSTLPVMVLRPGH
ncbi:MAG: universal stress protein [Pseudomonadota bacterium]|nr:universal stress protein [Pseudomonadota bacterium]